MLGKALKGRRDEVVLATKFHLPMGEDVNARGNSRRWIMRAVEGSLKRLQTDYIDLYQAHRPDGDVEETLSALTDLVRAGQGALPRARPRSRRRQIVEAQWVAEASAGWSASCASSRPTASSCAGSRTTSCRRR